MAKSLTYKVLTSTDKPIVYKHRVSLDSDSWQVNRSREIEFDAAIKEAKALFKDLSTTIDKVAISISDNSIFVAVFSFEDSLILSLKSTDFNKVAYFPSRAEFKICSNV